MPDLEDLSRGELIALIGAQVEQIGAQAERIGELSAANEALSVDSQTLIGVNESLTGKLTDTEGKLTDVEGMLAKAEKKLAKALHLLSRNSGNSSKAPSSDGQLGGMAPKPKTPRSGGPVRPKGKQPGAPGSHLGWAEVPGDQVDVFPQGVCACGAGLGEAADLGVVDQYQQTEIPQVVAKVTQYDQHAVRCGCGKVHTAGRPAGVLAGRVGYGPHLAAFIVYLLVVHHLPTQRCAQLLESLTGAKPSVGFVHGMLARTSTALSVVDTAIRALVVQARVVRMDETPIRVGPKKPKPGRKKADMYLLVACTDRYTYFLLGDRDLATFQKSVLSELAAAGAVVVHDRYHLYDHPVFAVDVNDPAFVGVVHQLCCQHLCRDLDDAGEVYPEQGWPEQISKALRGLIHATNLARHQVSDAHDRRYCHYCQPQDLPAASVEELLYTLRQGVLVGLSATTSHGDRPGERKARLLLECLHERQDDVLRFVTDPDIPATSNDAERALRPSKIQQNASGRLTSVEATKDRYRILGYVQTAVKHGLDELSVLVDVMLDRPWMPGRPAPT